MNRFAKTSVTPGKPFVLSRSAICRVCVLLLALGLALLMLWPAYRRSFAGALSDFLCSPGLGYLSSIAMGCIGLLFLYLEIGGKPRAVKVVFLWLAITVTCLNILSSLYLGWIA